jgi:hypothetical protein
MSRPTSKKLPILLPPTPLSNLYWFKLLGLFHERTIRKISRDLASFEFESLRERVFVPAQTIRQDNFTNIKDAELSQLFGYSGGRAQGMIPRHFHQVQVDNPVSRGRPRLAESERATNLIVFCLKRQAEKQPVSVENVIDFMRESGVQVDRFWVHRFLKRNVDTLALREASFLEKDRHNVITDDLKRYFHCVESQIRTVPSPFAWNTDETRVGAPTKQQAPRVIIAAHTGPEVITVPEIRDDSRLAL